MNPRRMAGLAGVLLVCLTQVACGSSSSSSSSSSSTTGTASGSPTTSTGSSTSSTTIASSSTSATAGPTPTATTSTTATSSTSSTHTTTTAVITVTPTQGSPRTRFTVSLTAPARTGVFGGFRRNYVVQVSSGAPRPECTSGGTVAIPPSAAGARVAATLDPARLGNPRWCTGIFNGKVVELRAPNCAAGQVCPAYVVVVGTVGRFTFRVS